MRHELKAHYVRWLAIDRATGHVLQASLEVPPLSYAECEAVEELRNKFRDHARTVTLKRYVLDKEEAPPVRRDRDWDNVFATEGNRRCPNHGAHTKPCPECAREWSQIGAMPGPEGDYREGTW